jgi:hypothetical protein
VNDPIPFLDRLGAQLETATPQRPDRRPTLLRAGGALAVAAAVVVAVVAWGAWRSEPVSAGVDVSRSGGRVVLRVTGEAPPAAEIEEVARRNGLRIDVQAAPVGPSEVGKMFIESPDDSAQARFGTDAVETTHDGFDVISFPLNWTGHLSLYIGRTAHEGELYRRGSNALAPGEPLACRFRSTPQEVEAIAERDGLVIRWMLVDPDTQTSREDVDYGEVLAAKGYLVSSADAIAAKLLIVELTPEGRVVRPGFPTEFAGC